MEMALSNAGILLKALSPTPLREGIVKLRRQRGDMDRNGTAVGLAKQSSVANDFGHPRAGEIAGSSSMMTPRKLRGLWHSAQCPGPFTK
jgi:hypothetical protein